MKNGDSSDIKHKKAAQHRTERGNVFFTLFGAVAVVGILGSGIMATMKGPLSTMVEINRIEEAKADMRVGSRLLLIQASDQDSDSETEPVAPSSTNCNVGAANAGCIPSSVSAKKVDPWGVQYAYCAWNLGSDNSSIGTIQAGDANINYYTLALISAGPDQTFQSNCAGSPPSISEAGDDIVVPITYVQAVAGSGGLWSLADADSTTAEIEKNIDVTGNAAFSGDFSLAGTVTSQLKLGAASMLLPTDAELTTCNGGNANLLRINTTPNPNRLEICDTTWKPAAGLWDESGGNISYSAGNVTVGQQLTVTGAAALNGGTTTTTITASGAAALNGGATTTTFTATGAADLDSTLNVDGNTTLGGTLDVTGDTTVAVLNATGAADLDSTLNVDGNTTLGGTLDVTGDTTVAVLNATGAADLDSTLNVDGNTTLGGTLDVTGASSLAAITATTIDTTGDIDTDTKFTIGGTKDLTPVECNDDQERIYWDGNNWDCETATPGGSGTSGALALDDLDDVDVSSPSDQECLMYNSSSNKWESTDCTDATPFEVFDTNGATAGGELVRNNNSEAPYQYADFVFGSNQLDDDSGTTNDNARMFFDKSKGAFRAGYASGTQWDSASIGDYSTAFGNSLTASGVSSAAIGAANTASADYSMALGRETSATGWASLAMGYQTTAGGNQGIAIGREVRTAGSNNFAIGLGNQTDTNSSRPIITGSNSMTIFMGDQQNVDITTSNLLALIGGSMIINPDSSSASVVAPTTGLELQVVGDIGADYYCDQNAANCFTAGDIGNEIWTPDGSNNYIEYDDALGGVRIGKVTGQPAPAIDWTLNTATSVVSTSNGVAIGGSSLSSGDQDLELDVTGDIGADNYCDADGNNCFTASALDSSKIHDTDGNTQIQTEESANEDKIRFDTAGTERMIIDDSGKVGINNTSPSVTLDVQAASGSGNIRVTNNPSNGHVSFTANRKTTSQNAVLSLQTDGTTNWLIGMTDGTDGTTSEDFNIRTGASATSRFHITSAGKVGIGDKSPDGTLLLDVEGQVGATEYCDENGANCIAAASLGGAGALNDLSDAITDYVTDNNMFIGDNSGLNAASGAQYNTVLGQNAFAGTTTNTADHNIALGYGTLGAITSGGQNTALGSETMAANTSGQNNTAVGRLALGANEAGSYNTIMGTRAARYNEGDHNVVIGRDAGEGTISSSTYDSSVLIGSAAGNAITTGDNNITIGYQAGDNITTGSNNIIIGYDIDAESAGVSNSLNIGNIIQGNTSSKNVSIGTTPQNARLTVVGPATNDGIALYSLSEGGVQPPPISFYRSIGTPSASPRFKISPYGDITSDADGFLFSSPNSSLNWIAGSNNNLHKIGLYSDATAAMRFYQRPYFTEGTLVIGLDSTSATPPESGVLRSGKKLDGSGSNITGSNLTLQPGAGSGNSTGNGNIIFQTPDAGASGTDAQTYSTKMSILRGGSVGIGDTSPDGTLLLDVEGQVGATEYCDEDGANCFTSDEVGTGPFEVTGAAGSEVVRNNNTLAPIDTADFVFGSSQLGDLNSGTTGDSRMFFDKSKSAFRAGKVQTNSWDDSNVGIGSVAFGLDNKATAQYSSVLSGRSSTASGWSAATTGESNTASGASSFASGFGNTASGNTSFALGLSSTASGGTSFALGQEIKATGTNTFAIGLSDQTDTAGNRPVVSGSGSMGIFMDQTDSYDLSATDQLAIIGGELMIDTDAIGTDKGCIRYNDTDDVMEFSNDCSTYLPIASTSDGASELNDLSDAITDYVTANSMYVGKNAGINATSGAINNTIFGINAFDATTTNAAQANTGFGFQVLSAITTGANNVAIGADVLKNTSTGNNNVALGRTTMENNTDGFNNIAIGHSALRANSSGGRNIAIGTNAVRYNTTGTANIGIGESAGNAITTGSNNIALGYQAGDNLTTGSNNIIIGYDINAASATATDTLNIGDTITGDLSTGDVTVAGNLSATNITTTDNGINGNIAIGTNANVSGGTSFPGIAIGNNTTVSNAWGGIAIGKDSTASGQHALTLGNGANSAGNNGIAIGSYSKANHTNSIAFGRQSAGGGTTANNQIVFGGISGGNDSSYTDMYVGNGVIATTKNTDFTINASGGSGTDQTGVNLVLAGGKGTGSGTGGALIFKTSNAGVSGTTLQSLTEKMRITTDGDVVIGDTSASGTLMLDVEGQVGATEYCDEDGANCIAAASLGGVSDLNGLSDAITDYVTDNNIFVGNNAGINVASGSTNNTVLGQDAFAAITTNAADWNTGIGFRALNALTTGDRNTGVGGNALLKTTTGAENVALGVSALSENLTGNRNTAIGKSALNLITSGSNNATLGYAAGNNITTGSNNTTLGYAAGDNITTGSNNIIIGYGIDAASTTGSNQLNIGNTIYADLSNDHVGIGTNAPTANFHVKDASASNSSSHYVISQIEKSSDHWLLSEIYNNNNNSTASAPLAGFAAKARDTETAETEFALFGLELRKSDGAEGRTIISAPRQLNFYTNFHDSDYTYNNFGDFVMALTEAGNVGIGTGSTSGTLKLDVEGQVGATEYCDESGANCFTTSDVGNSPFTVTGSAGSEIVIPNASINPPSTADFVFGSTQLDDTGDTTNDNRFFFDKSKGAFRAGHEDGDRWNSGNLGTYSFAAGNNNKVQGSNAVALGAGNSAAGNTNVTIGGNNTTNGLGNNIVLGYNSTASGGSATAIGNGVKATTPYAMALGLSDQNNNDALRPQVSGAGSLGIFMDQTDSYDLSATDQLGIIGGELMIDTDGNATDKGCIRYNDSTDALEFSNDCSTYLPIASTSDGASELNDLSDAITDYVTDHNMFAGNNAGANVVVGAQYNTIFGESALDATLTNAADYNSAFGYSSLGANTSGNRNAALGSYTLALNTTGANNTALGDNALGANTTGSDNVGIGRFANRYNSTGTSNVTIGSSAGLGVDSVTTNSNNVFIGFEAAKTITTGSNNITLGYKAGDNITTGSNNIIIGYDVNAVSDGAVNSINIGNLIAGHSEITTPAQATAQGAFAVGDGTSATGVGAFAAGDGASATGTGAIAIGSNATASGPTSAAIGLDSTASGNHSLALGRSTTATASRSTAIGYQTTSSGVDSLATGTGTTASGASSTAMGQEVQATAVNTFAIGLADQSSTKPVVSGSGSMGIFMDDAIAYNLSATDQFAIIGGELMIDGDAIGSDKGCIRYNDTSDVMEFSNDCSTYLPIASTSDGASELNDLSDAATDYVTANSIYIGNNAGLNAPSTATQNIVLGINALDAVLTSAADKNTAIGYNALTSNTSGSANVAIGPSALGSNTSGSANIAIGSDILTSITTAGGNIGIGNSVLMNSTTDGGNISMGQYSGQNIDAGGNNIFMGYTAGRGNAGVPTTTSNSNIFIGPNQGSNVENAARNVFVGNADSSALRTGNHNVALGHNAGNNISSGSENIMIGTNTTAPSATGNYQLNIGNTLYGDLNGKTLGIGDTTPDAHFEVSANGTTGGNAFLISTDDDNNGDILTVKEDGKVGIGDTTPDGTLKLDVEGQIGATEYCDENGANCVAAASLGGVSDLNGLSDAITDYVTDHNMFVGNNAGINVASGAQYNTVFGEDAFDAALTNAADYNTAFGSGSLTLNTSGADNTAIGFRSLYSNTSGSSNTALGRSVLSQNTTGSNNVAVGYGAGDNITTGSNNIIIGYDIDALSATVDDHLNIGDAIYGDLSNSHIGIGVIPEVSFHVQGAASSGVTPSNIDGMFVENGGSNNSYYVLQTATNVGVGLSVTNAGNVGIGTGTANARLQLADNVSETATANQIRLFDSGSGTVFGMGISSDDFDMFGKNYRFHTGSTNASRGTERFTILNSGNVGIGTTAPDSALHVVGDIRYTGSLIDTSDRRLKTDIKPLTELSSATILERIDQINGYSFRMKDDENGKIEYGVMAQEVEKVFPELVFTADDEMGTKSVAYSGLIAPLIEATKELKAQNEELKIQIAQRDQRLNDLEARMANFELAVQDVKGLKALTGYNTAKGSFASLAALLGLLTLLGSFGATYIIRHKAGGKE